MQDPEYRRDCYVSHCILNAQSEIQLLMGTYDKDDFITMKDESGNNGVALAAIEGHQRLIAWLLGKYCDINNINCRGRTPLMAAALWGRHEVVDYLLGQGAHANLKDHKGRTALDLALPSQRNKNERKRYSHMYHEPSDKDQHRHLITLQLQKVTCIHSPAASSELDHHISAPGLFLAPTETSLEGYISYYEQKQLYPIPDGNKAIGQLHRGPLFPVISAMSGYTHSGWDDNEEWVRVEGEHKDLSLVMPPKLPVERRS